MFRNYLLTAFRNLGRNKLYSCINIAGLSIGLALFVATQIITSYERNHDAFFPNAERIHAVYGIFKPDAGLGVRSNIGVQSTVAPLLRADIPGVESVARLLTREYLAQHEDRKFYQPIRFADPAFLDIFQLDFMAGDAATALQDPDGLIITASMAEKYFGDENAVGKVIRFNNKYELHVTAVIADLPLNSHFTTSIIVDEPLQMIATTAALARLSDFKLEGDWNNMSGSDITYVLLHADTTVQRIDSQLARLYEKHVPERHKEYLQTFELRSLTQLNLYPWEATGLPVMTSIEVLGLLILIIAIFNFTNLSTAQLLGRTREVGLRRVMGASRLQMFVQFMTESMALAGFALVLAVALISIVLPMLNDVTDKGIALDLFGQPQRLLWLCGLVVLVGGLAGSYPAWLIARGRTVMLLKGGMTQGRRPALVRSSMIVAQFAIALFMMICVGIIYTQNQMMNRSSDVFDRDRIVTLERMDRDEIKTKVETLRSEMERLPGVTAFAVSSQVPFEQDQSMGKFGLTPGDEANSFELYRISIDRNFLKTYDIELLTGRNFSEAYSDDILITDEEKNPVQGSVNVIVNGLTLAKLGFSQANAPGQRFYRFVQDGPTVEYRIVGVIPDANFLGFHNALKAIVFVNRPDIQRIASLKLKGESMPETLAAIDKVWGAQAPDFPIERKFLDDHFNDIYKIFRSINIALAGFASLAVLVASIGLFGMAAFMAERRTREIGIRKVLGANTGDIVKLLLLQFSQPVFIAILLASPLAYFSAGLYLNFFAERAALPWGLFIGAGLALLLLAWLTVATHAVRVAQSNPILALRYE